MLIQISGFVDNLVDNLDLFHIFIYLTYNYCVRNTWLWKSNYTQQTVQNQLNQSKLKISLYVFLIVLSRDTWQAHGEQVKKEESITLQTVKGL